MSVMDLRRRSPANGSSKSRRASRSRPAPSVSRRARTASSSPSPPVSGPISIRGEHDLDHRCGSREDGRAKCRGRQGPGRDRRSEWPNTALHARLDPDGREIIVANYRSNNVSIVDVARALAHDPHAEVARIAVLRPPETRRHRTARKSERDGDHGERAICRGLRRAPPRSKRSPERHGVDHQPPFSRGRRHGDWDRQRSLWPSDPRTRCLVIREAWTRSLVEGRYQTEATRRGSKGTGPTGSPFLPLRGRLQYLCSQPSRR